MKRLALALSAALSLGASAALFCVLLTGIPSTGYAIPQPTMDQHTAALPLPVSMAQGPASSVSLVSASNIFPSLTITGFSVASFLTVSPKSTSTWLIATQASNLMTVAPLPTATWIIVTQASNLMTIAPLPTATFVLGAGTAAIGGVTMAQGPAGSVTIITTPANLMTTAPAPSATYLVTNLVYAVPASNTTLDTIVPAVAAVTAPTCYNVSVKNLATTANGATLFQNIPAGQPFKVFAQWSVSNGAAVTDNFELQVAKGATGALTARLYRVPLTSILGASVYVYESPWMTLPYISSVLFNTVSTGSTGNVDASLLTHI